MMSAPGHRFTMGGIRYEIVREELIETVNVKGKAFSYTRLIVREVGSA